jgi:hypothetical protein
MNTASGKHTASTFLLATLAWFSLLLQCDLSLRLANRMASRSAAARNIYIVFAFITLGLLSVALVRAVQRTRR